MTDLQHWIDRCCRRLNRGLVLKVLAEWLAVWLCAFGTLLLMTKVAWPALWPGVLWLGVSLVPVVALAVRRALRDRYTPTDGAALLDRRVKAGGLLMAVAEKPNGRWREQLPREEAVWTTALPKLRPVRFARVVVLPLVFAFVALLLPARQVPSKAATSRRTLPAVRELPQMLAQLKQAEVLDPEEAAFLNEEIGKLVESTSQAPPTPETWRKIDALRARLNDRLDRESRTIEKGRRAARKLAQAGKNGIPPLTKEQRRQLEKDLADALKRSRQAKKSGTLKAGKTKAEGGKRKADKRKRNLAKSPGKSSAKLAGKKVPAGKVPAAKTPMGGATQGKTPSNKKKKAPAGKSLKQGAKAGKKQGRPAGKSPSAFDPSNLRDLAKIAKMVENLPPELQEKLKQEVMQMLQSGEIRIPNDPAVRELLMKQAQQMLEQDGRRLEELQKRFGHLAGNFQPWKNADRPSANPRNSSAGTEDGGTGTGQPRGKRTGSGAKKTAGAVSFRDVVLPPGLLDKPRNDPDSVSGRRPTVTPFQPTVPTNSTAGNDRASTRWRALRRKVRPRNRELVYKYFYGKDDSNSQTPMTNDQ